METAKEYSNEMTLSIKKQFAWHIHTCIIRTYIYIYIHIQILYAYTIMVSEIFPFIQTYYTYSNCMILVVYIAPHFSLCIVYGHELYVYTAHSYSNVAHNEQLIITIAGVKHSYMYMNRRYCATENHW